MKILISGGSGFLGRALTDSFLASGDRVEILSRTQDPNILPDVNVVRWDGMQIDKPSESFEDVDVIIQLAGKTLASWPWTASKKKEFLESRIGSGRALVAAVNLADRKPRLLLQQSGVNFYGLEGEPAEETTPPGKDYLALLAVQTEESTRPMEDLGVRRIVTRSAVVLARNAGLLPLMTLPVVLFVGGPVAGGTQAMPWIHLKDWVAAVRHLITSTNASGAYNLISPTYTSNADFYHLLCNQLHRPYWFPTPAFLFNLILGEMAEMLVYVRYVRPIRLLDSGFRFQFDRLDLALAEVFM
jgi:hypothetical protein